MGVSETLKSLPGISHLAAMDLFAMEGTQVGVIENKPGQALSLAIYNHLAQLYGEHSEEARLNPGKHPNIDRLIGLIERNEMLRVKQRFAV